MQCERVWEGDQDEGLSKRAKKIPEVEGSLGMGLQDLLEEVLETNWLLCQLWQLAVEECQEVRSLMLAVEDVYREVHRKVWEMAQMCYTPCNTAPELRSTLPHDLGSFQDSYCVSILSTNLNSVFTLCA